MQTNHYFSSKNCWIFDIDSNDNQLFSKLNLPIINNRNSSECYLRWIKHRNCNVIPSRRRNRIEEERDKKYERKEEREKNEKPVVAFRAAVFWESRKIGDRRERVYASRSMIVAENEEEAATVSLLQFLPSGPRSTFYCARVSFCGVHHRVTRKPTPWWIYNVSLVPRNQLFDETGARKTVSQRIVCQACKQNDNTLVKIIIPIKIINIRK